MDLVRTPRKHGRNNWFPASEINGLFGDLELRREARRMAGDEPFDPNNRADWNANVSDIYEELLAERIESDTASDSYESLLNEADGSERGDALRGVSCKPEARLPADKDTRIASSVANDNKFDEALESSPIHAFMPEAEYHTALSLIKKENSDDQKKAFEILRTLAERGHTASQAYLGWAYWTGFVVPQDSPAAAQWLRKAVDGNDNDNESRLDLGLILLKGDGVAENKAEAFCLFLQAASNGNAEAMNSLAMCYLRGHGTEQDSQKALHWLEAAVKMDCEVAQYNLGLRYFLGDFIERDYAKALSLLKLAARWTGKEACPSEWYIYYCYKDGLGTDRNVTEADEWLKKGVSRECPRAMMELGRHYMCGDGVECDYTQGAGLLRKAADGGDAGGQYFLGIAFLNGHGVQQDDGEAVKWFYLAAKQKHNGTGEFIVSSDEATACMWDLIAPLISSRLRNSQK